MATSIEGKEQQLPYIRKELQLQIQELSLSQKNQSRISPTFFDGFVKSKKPTVIFLLTTWGAGGDILGELLTRIPGSFVHYEPFKTPEWDRALNETTVPNALKLIKALVNCEFSNLTDYVNFLKNRTHALTPLFKSGIVKEEHLKYINGNYLRQACQMFPVHIVISVRMFMSQLLPLLSNEAINLKIIHLVRDPRAIFISRIENGILCDHESYSNPQYYCAQTEKDLQLNLRDYEDKYLLVNYEDLLVTTIMAFERISLFLQIPYVNDYISFIKAHMSGRKLNRHWRSTYHKAKENVDKWKKDKDKKEFKDTEKACESVINMLGC